MDQPPKNLRALPQERSLQVTWEEGHVGVYAYRYLRGECHCASCVDEWTGVRRLDLDSIPPDILITNMQLVGNYAMKIDWSDGHNTGIYTWKRLRELCSCPKSALSEKTQFDQIDKAPNFGAALALPRIVDFHRENSVAKRSPLEITGHKLRSINKLRFEFPRGMPYATSRG